MNSSMGRVTIDAGLQVGAGCRLGGTGRSTAWGRRPRTAEPAGTSTSLPPRRVGRRAAGDPNGDFDLQPVGVLELIEQQPPVAVLQRGPHRGLAAQQVAGEHEQVVELQPPLDRAGAGVVDDPAPDPGDQPADDIVEGGGGGVGRRLVQVPQRVADLVDAPVPVALLPETGVGSGDGGEEAERFGLVGAVELGAPVLYLVETQPQLVVPGAAELRHLDELVGVAAQRVGVEAGARRQHCGDAFVDKVPVAVEGHGQCPEVVEADAGGEREPQHGRGVGVLEQFGLELVVAPVGGDAGGDGVEDLDQRRQPGLDGVLGEDAAGERVQGADGGTVEVVERLVVTTAGELHAQPVTELGGGLLGERHRRDVADRDAVGDERDDPFDQRACLSRARAGLDEQGVGEVGADPLAGVLVGDHAAPPAGEGGAGKSRAWTSGRASRSSLSASWSQEGWISSPSPSGSQATQEIREVFLPW